MATHIHLPEEPTYYIILDGSNVISYGLLLPHNCLDTPHDVVETFLDETEYTQRLESLGVDSSPETADGPPVPPPAL